MGQTFGWFFAGFPILSVTLSVIIFLRRQHVFIRPRNPFLLIMQNIGATAATFIFGLYIALRPDFSCELLFAALVFDFSLFAVPILLRVWEYCVNYHISLLKLQYRSSFFQNWKKTSWFFQHKWVGSPIFLTKLYVVLTIVVSSVCFIALAPNQFSYSPVSEGCAQSPLVLYAATLIAILALVAMILMGFLIYKAKDVYYIKRELTILAPLWLILIITFAVYSSIPRESMRTFPTVTLIVILHFITLFICNVFPLYYTIQYDRASRAATSRSLEHFTRLLQMVDFRNVFHDFLTKQFCQENLQFYEAVDHWKNLRHNDPMRATKAKAVVEVFIVEGSVCQVHVNDDIRDKLLYNVTLEDIPQDTFDDALDALIEDMHVNSYRQYKSMGRYMALDSFSSDVESNVA